MCRSSQQIEGCILRFTDLPGNRGGGPQTRFRVAWAQCLLHNVLVVAVRCGQFREDAALRLKGGVCGQASVHGLSHGLAPNPIVSH